MIKRGTYKMTVRIADLPEFRELLADYERLKSATDRCGCLKRFESSGDGSRCSSPVEVES